MSLVFWLFYYFIILLFYYFIILLFVNSPKTFKKNPTFVTKVLRLTIISFYNIKSIREPTLSGLIRTNVSITNIN